MTDASVSRAEMIPLDADLTASLSGFVYADVDNSGTKDSCEMGLRDVTVVIDGVDDQGSNLVNRSVITSGDGSYEFTGLFPGIYSLTEITPEIYIEGKANKPGTAGGIAVGSNQFAEIVLAGGVAGTNYNFCEWGLRPEFISKRPYLVVPEPSTMCMLLVLSLVVLCGSGLSRLGREA